MGRVLHHAELCQSAEDVAEQPADDVFDRKGAPNVPIQRLVPAHSRTKTAQGESASSQAL